MFSYRYRISKDSCLTYLWAVQCWRWWWPFWTEEIGLIRSLEEARQIIEILRE